MFEEEIKYNNIIKQYKMINFEDVIRKMIKEHYTSWPQIPDHPYRILIFGGYGTSKTNELLNLISHQSDIDKINLYDNDPYEAKCELLICGRKGVGLRHFNDYKAFIEYANNMGYIYENVEEYNLSKKRKTLIIFHDMIADILSNKKLQLTVAVLFMRGRK